MQGERTNDRGGALDHWRGPAGRLARCAAAGAAAALAICLAAGPVAAAPGDDEAGKGLFFVRKRDCARAVPWLEKAEKIRHRPSTAVALAECYLGGGDVLRAGQLLHRAADEKPARSWGRPDYNARKAAQGRLAEVDARIPTVHFQAPPATDGIEIEVDGVAVTDLGVERQVAPGAAVTIVARAPGRQDFSDKVTLKEGEHRVVVLRLPRTRPTADGTKERPPPSSESEAPTVEASATPSGISSSGRATPTAPPPTSWLGVRYYGVVIPKFVMNFVADGGRNLPVPGGAFTFTTLVSDVEVTAALGYLSFRMGDTPFKPHGDPDTEWEIDSSTLGALTATVDLMWSFPLDASGNVAFRVGGAAGFGWMFLGDLYRVQAYPANGVPGDPSTYLKCVGPNNPRGTYRYCNALDKDASHYPGYTEPDWFHHGIRPAIFPWLVLPQLGLSFRPSRTVAIDVETGVSIAGFLTTLGARVAL